MSWSLNNNEPSDEEGQKVIKRQKNNQTSLDIKILNFWKYHASLPNLRTTFLVSRRKSAIRCRSPPKKGGAYRSLMHRSWIHYGASTNEGRRVGILDLDSGDEFLLVYKLAQNRLCNMITWAPHNHVSHLCGSVSPAMRPRQVIDTTELAVTE